MNPPSANCTPRRWHTRPRRSGCGRRPNGRRRKRSSDFSRPALSNPPSPPRPRKHTDGEGAGRQSATGFARRTSRDVRGISRSGGSCWRRSAWKAAHSSPRRATRGGGRRPPPRPVAARARLTGFTRTRTSGRSAACGSCRQPSKRRNGPSRPHTCSQTLTTLSGSSMQLPGGPAPKATSTGTPNRPRRSTSTCSLRPKRPQHEARPPSPRNPRPPPPDTSAPTPVQASDPRPPRSISVGSNRPALTPKV
mmetsp:Transcript_62415/g.111200  ORF Transcript_62415/g.111200 Transcript_62415/m.111200 type:complete len:250 (-) Transcript_62415:828-1577(-)